MHHNRSLPIVCGLTAVFILAGCTTSFHKAFVVGGEPKRFSQIVHTHEFMLGISLDAFPSNESTYRDSSYAFTLSVTKYSQDCTAEWSTFIRSLELESLSLTDGSATIAAALDSVEHFAPCMTYWHFRDVIIPDMSDTLTMHMRLHYAENNQSKTLDTTIELYRIQAKYREMMFW